jgi:hypothetical protein
VLSRKASATDHFLRLILLKSRGVISSGRSPCTHGEFQKSAFIPFPKVMVVQLVKKSLSLSVHGTSMPTHDLSREAHSYRDQRNRRAVVNLFRSRTPDRLTLSTKLSWSILTCICHPKSFCLLPRGSVCGSCLGLPSVV